MRLLAAETRRPVVGLGLAGGLLLAAAIYFVTRPLDPRTIAKRALQSVVLLEPMSVEGEKFGEGTGFLVAPDKIVTNLHVVKGAWTLSARTVNPQIRVQITGLLGIDRENDLVLLKTVAGSGRPLPLSDEKPIEVGDEVFVAGNPRGLAGTFSAGIVSALRREGRRLLLQITAPISPGSSGSPVLDRRGRVVGIAFGQLRDGQNLNFATPVSALAPMLRNAGKVLPIYYASLGSGRDRDHQRLLGPVREVEVSADDGGILKYILVDDILPGIDRPECGGQPEGHRYL